MNVPITVFFLVIIVNLWLVYRLFKIRKTLDRMTSVLDDIINGNFNRRFFIYSNHTSVIKKFCVSLNGFMDKYNDTVEKIQKMQRVQKKMISDISHDIRTPLTSLLGYVEVLEKQQDLDDETKSLYFNVISTKAQALYTLVQKFFDLVKLESDDTFIQLQKINLTEQIQNTLVSYYHDFTCENIEPIIQIPDKPLFVLGDGSSIDRIMQNLLSNALRYGKDGRIVGIALKEEANRVWVNVWDKGKGIPIKDQKFIFDRLYTAETSRGDNICGSGLGLTIAKKLVEKQEGEIFVSSIPEEKTTFSFYLKKLL